jgi:hypothetical protein
MGAPEAIPPAVTTQQAVGHWIGGRLQAGGGASQPVWNPATGAVARQVRPGGEAEVQAAVAAAQAAQPAWAAWSPLRRARAMNAFLALMNQHKDELAAIITAEHGKVLSDAQGEVMCGIDIVEFACGIPQLLKGNYAEQVSTGIDNWTLRQPLGVAEKVRVGESLQAAASGQLPDLGSTFLAWAVLDVPGGAGLRQRLHPQAQRTRPQRQPADGAAAAASRAAGRRLQRRAGRQAGG